MSMYRRRLMIANALKKSSGINYPGLIAAWSAKGKTNDDEDRNILRDLTGNGHDITLNGFAFSEMSGYGGYSTNFNNWGVDISIANIERTSTSFKLTPHKENGKLITSSIRWTNNTTSVKFKFRVNEFNGTSLKLQQQLFDSSGANIAEDILADIQVNQEYVVTIDNIDSKYVRRNIIFSGTDTNILAVELLPEYPDALVFDGVDDYGRSIDKIKALTEYTVILKRNIIKPIEYAVSFYKGEGPDDVNSNFFIEYYERSKWHYGNGYSSSGIEYYNENIIYVTEKSYNGQTVNMDFRNVVDNPVYLGKITGNWCHNMAFYSAYLFDRSLDEQEIKEFIRKYIDPEYLLPSEIPTPDCYYDFSLGSNDDENRETIKDQSGNGNDAKAYNIAWNEEGSGYKDGALYLDGTDDYIALEAFNSGFKTMFMLVNPLSEQRILYDHRFRDSEDYAIFNSGSYIAYTQRNVNGAYINGVFNTTVICGNLVNKKHLITVNSKLESSKMPIIGANNTYNGLFSNMAIYKFLGFKEELTEEQIQAIIKKYNLLDGVDEIEVS